MTESAREWMEQRVLVLTPTTKDAALTRSVFVTAGLVCYTFNDLIELCAQLDSGVGAIMVPEEALIQDSGNCLAEWLKRQPPWSDVPVLVLARFGADSAAVAEAMDVLGNVTVLERPIRVAALVSTVRTALRARMRQYQNREYLSERERSERELRDFFENASIALHWVGPDGTILRANQTELNMLGYTPEEYIGHDVAEFHVDKEAIEDILKRLNAGETLVDYIARLRCKDGSIKDVLIDSSVLWENGRFVHTRSFTRDVTDRKRAEEALREANRRKDEFLAILAHELRNPLAPIRNSLHILRLGATKDPTVARVVEMMERQVNHTVRLVDDLLDVSRITRGKITLRKERVELETIVRSAVDASRPLIEAARHNLIISMSPEPLILDGDSVRLTQVLANLLNNAAKYTKKGGQIWLTVQREGESVKVSVKDTGAGIPAELLPHVFELFMQVERSAGRAEGGLGIGLTLVKSLVEMHGGTVQARSAGAGKGSEFVVSLPLAVVSRVDETKTSDRPLAPIAQRVLVCDDNRDAAESLGILLELLGAETKVVYSGADALEAVATYEPTVVLLDIGMPGMDGYEVARRIREQPNFKNVILIALSGWGQDEDRRRSRLAGFDYHLIKPADLHNLETVLIAAERRA